MDALYIATIFISLFSAVLTLTGNTFNWMNRVRAIELELNLHMQEIKLLNGVLEESEEFIEYVADELPTSIRNAHQLCRAHQDILGESLWSNDLGRGIHTKSSAKTAFRKVKTTLNEDEWKKAFRLYRGSVFMLRDLCAE
jgi:hypothetical protein